MERKIVKPNGKITLKMVVACTNANGDADLFFFILDDVPEDRYDLGEHFDAAMEHAENEGYDHPMVVFDDTMPVALEEIFVWETASIVKHT